MKIKNKTDEFKLYEISVTINSYSLNFQRIKKIRVSHCVVAVTARKIL